MGVKDHISTFRFYAELNDFLPPARRQKDAIYRFRGSPSVKDAIEAQGVPHPEVDLILANSRSVGFDYQLRDGDRVAVYPVFESFDISEVERLHLRPLRNLSFVADAGVGRLARWLRLLGFDTLYRNDFQDSEVIAISRREGRIILTRDMNLLKCREVSRGRWIRATHPDAQVKEVLRRFDAAASARPFSRCLECNALLESEEKENLLDRLQPGTRLSFHAFHVCPDCGRIYWRGSHYDRLAKKVKSWLGEY